MATRQPIDESSADSSRIGAEHPHYAAVVNKRFNKRFTARPDYVGLAATAGHVVSAVQDAVNDQQRIVVTSGGHLRFIGETSTTTRTSGSETNPSRHPRNVFRHALSIRGED